MVLGSIEPTFVWNLVRKRPIHVWEFDYHGRAMNFDWQARRRARVARDVRFDGKFFVGILSTKIYCRPSCPVPTVTAFIEMLFAIGLLRCKFPSCMYVGSWF
jgi:hypothetical protein